MSDSVHIPDYELERFYRGDSDPLEALMIQEHLDVCRLCRDRLEEAGRFVQTLWVASGRDESGRDVY
jgi:predicted anti-sigma-YlaC factor YlaD